MNYYRFLAPSLIIVFGVRAATVNELQTDLNELNALLAQVREQFAALTITVEPSEQQKKEAEEKKKQELKELEKREKEGIPLSEEEQEELFEELQKELNAIAKDFEQNQQKYYARGHELLEKIKNYLQLADELDRQQQIPKPILQLRAALLQRSPAQELKRQETDIINIMKGFNAAKYRFKKEQDVRAEVQASLANLNKQLTKETLEENRKNLEEEIARKTLEISLLPKLSAKDAISHLIGQINGYEKFAHDDVNKNPNPDILEFRNKLVAMLGDQLLEEYNDFDKDLAEYDKYKDYKTRWLKGVIKRVNQHKDFIGQEINAKISALGEMAETRLQAM